MPPAPEEIILWHAHAFLSICRAGRGGFSKFMAKLGGAPDAPAGLHKSFLPAQAALAQVGHGFPEVRFQFAPHLGREAGMSRQFLLPVLNGGV
jgi:hypothetical protein